VGDRLYPYFDRVAMTESEKNNLDETLIYPKNDFQFLLLRSKITADVLTL